MTNLDVSNSSTDSSSGSSSDSSSSDSTSTSSGSGSSSSDSESSTSDTPVTSTAPAPKSPTKAKEPEKKEDDNPETTTKSKASSSSDDDVPKLESPKTLPPRRRCSAKPKTVAMVLAKGKTALRSSGAKTPKPAVKTGSKPKPETRDSNALKKKSIFSPDNSSESESESKSLKSPKESPRSKRSSRKSSEEKVAPATPLGNDDSNSKDSKDSKDSVKRKNGNKANGPPSKKSPDNKSVSSCSSSQSSIESVSSDSDSEPSTKKENGKTGKVKPNPTKQQEDVIKIDTLEATMPRKLTRSLSARVSRIAAATKINNTDTDSEVDEKEKGKDTKKPLKGRPGIQTRSPVIPPLLTTAEPSERRCPVRGCDSLGHLGGKAERHFTWAACPLYHNVSGAWCAAASEERAAAAAARRRALAHLSQRPRSMPTIEQRAYQLKVKDMRSKWKGSQELNEKLAASGNDELTEEREPILEGFAPDYDLRLFREAQALAAIKIEEELGEIITDRGTRFVVMGKYMMEVWYQSPYPGAAARVPRLFVCEFCLAHQQSAAGAARHRDKCVWRHPPGDEVYRKDDLSVWQVDGRKHKQYCQQLCLLAKFFLDHKTLYYDVEPFLFYVMTNADSEGCHIVGYFSKEKNSFLNYNVSCILTLPPYQRQGYGRLLIDFSYLLTKVEGKVGSPETPLSDLGLISYRSYWKEALLKRLCSASGSTLCIRDLSKDLAIASSDIVSTLQERGLMKYWKGKHIVLKKQEVLEEAMRRAGRARCVEPACLRWWAGGGGGGGAAR
ncbi:histone acetyltransferase KAT7 isoform X3 [Bombyx mandarina]|uniref:Histone acetyltransferase n=2 Tax=Bombyx TaxID=7090 RepID=A0A8R2HN42_BOMMO|nr:histone acetyltransferase KAT7 isoform X3 [Bombyx mori]XP_028030720.1 histone acetyltransferase KAT7 isoform X3 [Bombyx mandarina]